MNVYQLTALYLSKETDQEGARKTYAVEAGVFTSVENATEMMHTIRERDAAPWAFVLKERILDDLSPHGPFAAVSEFRSLRTYFADGTLNAENLCDDTGEVRWRGRDVSSIRFKPGDFVSVWTGSLVKPALVGDIPAAPSRFPKDSMGWEATDDCYLVYMAGEGHAHPFTPYVFPLAGELSRSMRVRLEAERVAEGDCA